MVKNPVVAKADLIDAGRGKNVGFGQRRIATVVVDILSAGEGVRLGKRWVIIYSKYDLGCALEKHPSSDCIGHDHESALKLAGAAVLYYLKN